MESPVVLDKPPEYHGIDDRGFPFDEEEGAGGWSELAARHPDIAARLRQRPATWARKRRPSSQDATDDFGDSFSGFDRFPFDDIPPEFREHFPSHWNRRFGSRDEPSPQTQSAPQAQASPPTPQPQQQTTATQTEIDPEPSGEQYNNLPQYGLRNTVDLGQKSPADPSLVDADTRNQRSMSAPPDSRNINQPTMNSQNHHDQSQSGPQATSQEHHSNVRHIPIFVEGRDEPVINKSVDSSTHFGDTKPTFQPPPPPPQAHPHPHIDRDQYFADDVPSFHHPPNFSRAFGTPFNKGFRQGPQPFTQQKAYPQGPFARGASPQRSQSPKPPPHQTEEHFVKVPVHHEQAPPRAETPSKPQQKQAPSPQQQPPPPQREQTPPQAGPKPQPAQPTDPITQILSIQTDVLNLMTEVENFTGTKKDKRYLFLDEMLTRNLIKLDNIETEGKENIRQARKEAIRCIQKCIAVLEAKAENNSANANAQQTQDVEMNDKQEAAKGSEPVQENGEVEMKDAKPEEQAEAKVEQEEKKELPAENKEVPVENKEATPAPAEATPQEQKPEATPNNSTQPQTTDAQPTETSANNQDEQKDVKTDKPSPKKKVVKKNRDKSASKDNKNAEAAKDSNKKDEKVEVMQVDDKADSQVMDVDGGASQ